MIIKIYEETENLIINMDISEVYTYSQAKIAKLIMDFIVQLNDYTDTFEKYPKKIKIEFKEEKEK